MADAIVKATIQEVEPLPAGETVAAATRRIVDLGLPALPVVEPDGKFAGIFGEREFLEAFFPGYVGTLTSARMVSRSLDTAIERRLSCREEPVSEHLTTDHVLVEDDYSDTHIAELFLHHRVLIIPIATEGRVHAIVTRRDFFRELAQKVLDDLEDVGT